MAKDPSKSLNNLYECYNEIEKAENREDKKGAKEALVEGLAQSCLLLKEIQRLLTEHRNSGNIRFTKQEVIELKNNPNSLQEFIFIEKELLRRSDVSPHLIDNLIAFIPEFINTDLSRKGTVSELWYPRIEWLMSEVCEEAKAKFKTLKRKPFLKRVLLAGGGGVVALVNISPPVIIQPHITASSTFFGLYLIQKSGDDQIGKFLE